MGIRTRVVPHAGTWIEIMKSREKLGKEHVVPHAGTWIEILDTGYPSTVSQGRSPRGNVD